MKRYALTAREWGEALRVLRRLRRRGARLVVAVFVVDVEDHRKVQKLPGNGSPHSVTLLMMLHSHPPGGPRTG